MIRFNKILASIVTVAILGTQIFGVWGYIIPHDNMLKELAEVQVAQAAFPLLGKGVGAGMGAAAAATSVPSITTFDTYQYANDWWKQLALGIAYSFAQKFMQRFVSKLTEKYKIRNFLYYDQILTNYYLTNFIRDKIQDPDLRQAYVLLESAYITGQPTYTTPGSGPDPKQAIIPRFKKAVSDLYKKQTGIDVKYIANPPADADVNNYLAQSRFYYLNNPGYTETNLRQQFGEFQTAATTAAQLEVIVGNGLKAGRYVGGKCTNISELQEGEGKNTNISTPADCERNGGTWQASALDQARSFIDNPTAYVNNWMDGIIKQISGSNFDPNNFWFTLGNAFGSFLYNNLLLDKPNGVLNEDPRGYVPVGATEGQGTKGVPLNTDIDGDGIADGYDVDNDGVVDTCVFGGTAPNCTGSRSIGFSGGGGGGGGGTGPCADNGTGTADYEGDLEDAINEVIATNPNGVADALNTTENSGRFLDEVASVLQSRGFESTAEVLNGNGNDSSTNDIIAIWESSDTLLERYDVIIGAGAGNTPLRDAIGIQYTGDIPVADCV